MNLMPFKTFLTEKIKHKPSKKKKAPALKQGPTKTGKRVPDEGNKPDSLAEEIELQMENQWNKFKALSNIAIPVASYGKADAQTILKTVHKVLKKLKEESAEWIRKADNTWWKPSKVIVIDDEIRIHFESEQLEDEDGKAPPKGKVETVKDPLKDKKKELEVEIPKYKKEKIKGKRIK